MYSSLSLLRWGVDWFEGSGASFRIIHRNVVFTPIASSALPCVSGHPYADPDGKEAQWLFREDSFDPVTRIRRGRLYQYDASGIRDYAHDRFDVDTARSGAHSVTPSASYTAWYPYTQVADTLPSAQMEIGLEPYVTAWRVVAVEGIPAGGSAYLLLTLKAISSFGALPELKDDLIDQAKQAVDRNAIQHELDKLVEAFHRQQPVPIVDVCRETTRFILARWLGDQDGPAAGLDLSDLLKRLNNGKRSIPEAAAFIVNRMHPRGKSAEREKQQARGTLLRSPVDADAETSVHLVGLILREIGWARH